MEHKGGDLMILFYALLLIVFGFCIGMIMEQDISRRETQNRMHDDEFCFHHCKIHEEVYSSFKDPDDAWRELDDGGHCIGCPMAQAMDIIDEAALAKWKKRQKKKEGKS